MNAAVKDSETAEYVSVEYDTLPVHQVGRGQPADSGWHWAFVLKRRQIGSAAFDRLAFALLREDGDLLSLLAEDLYRRQTK
jgi:hypothetical protein